MNILPFILPAFILAIFIVVMYKIKLRKSKNEVHFYITRDINKEFTLWIGRPLLIEGIWFPTEKAYMIITSNNMTAFGLNIDDYKDLKWKDKPVEVLINMED